MVDPPPLVMNLPLIVNAITIEVMSTKIDFEKLIKV